MRRLTDAARGDEPDTETEITRWLQMEAPRGAFNMALLGRGLLFRFDDEQTALLFKLRFG